MTKLIASCVLGIVCLALLPTFALADVPEKASPFAAVRWNGGQPQVKFNNQWYEFEKLDHLTKKQILSFAKKRFYEKWKKRFSEDLIQLLNEMGYEPKPMVTITLVKGGVSEVHKAELTAENRTRVRNYNRKSKKKLQKPKQYVSTDVALRNITEFRAILEKKSAYFQIAQFDFTTAISGLTKRIRSEKKPVEVHFLANELARILAEVGDRHGKIYEDAPIPKSCQICKKRFPFYTAVLDGRKVMALTKNANTDEFEYLIAGFPEVKSLGGTDIHEVIETYAFRHKKAPMATRWKRGVYDLRKLGLLRFLNGSDHINQIDVVLTNGRSDSAQTFPLSDQNRTYYSRTEAINHELRKAVLKGNFEATTKILNGNIGYLNIPKMFHPDEVSGYLTFIEETLSQFKSTKSLIIDIRNNGGGGREILTLVGSMVVRPEQSPWVTNVAYLRTDELIDNDVESMTNRYLYTYNSDRFSDSDRQAIDRFNESFSRAFSLSSDKFSQPFYMLLRSGGLDYGQPVYLLVNEQVFSAASIFTASLKGLPNVTIAGVTTDGSSGNSKTYALTESGIKMKVSTMVSLQRSGLTLDGNGTVPDIVIREDEEQMFGRRDTQLQKLMAIINEKPGN